MSNISHYQDCYLYNVQPSVPRNKPYDTFRHLKKYTVNIYRHNKTVTITLNISKILNVTSFLNHFYICHIYM